MKRTFTVYPSSIRASSETSGAAMRKKKREFEAKAKEGSELLATDGDWELWAPNTFEASVYLAGRGGNKARWDTAYEGQGSQWFDIYTERGPLYIFIKTSDPSQKYQYHPASDSFYDQYDRQANFDSFISEHPRFAEFFGIQ